MSWLKKLHIDTFLLVLIGAVIAATVLPCTGTGKVFFEHLTNAAIALLFFMHGAKLSREAIIRGISNWKLHSFVFVSTFVVFPILGIVLGLLPIPGLTPELYQGFLYLCVLPATVQSAIAFTSMARGNVPAAVCSASASTLLGVFVTPLLVNTVVLPHGGAGVSLDSVGRILLQLMLPFVAGHLLRPWIGDFVRRNAAVLKFVDQGSILLVVYTAFSAAVIEGLWKQVPLEALGGLLVVCAVLLALALTLTTLAARKLGFDKADEITIVFCGSKKSLASGVPMAKVLFPASQVGAIVLPLMLFHQIQLMVCAVLAQRYARRPATEDDAADAQPARG